MNKKQALEAFKLSMKDRPTAAEIEKGLGKHKDGYPVTPDEWRRIAIAQAERLIDLASAAPSAKASLVPSARGTKIDRLIAIAATLADEANVGISQEFKARTLAKFLSEQVTASDKTEYLTRLIRDNRKLKTPQLRKLIDTTFYGPIPARFAAKVSEIKDKLRNQQKP